MDTASDTEEDVAWPLSDSIVTWSVPVMLVLVDPLPAATLTLAEKFEVVVLVEVTVSPKSCALVDE